MSAVAVERTTAARYWWLIALTTAPAALTALGLVALEVWRSVEPRSSLFAPPLTYTLADAIEQHELEQAYGFIRAGQDPNELIGVRHPVITGGEPELMSPLLWAAAVGDREAVLMLLGAGARMDRPVDRLAPCVAEALGHVELADALRRYTPTAGSCRELNPAQAPLLALLAPGGAIRSANGHFHLIYQHDGNLVLYDRRTRAPLWATNTERTSAGRTLLHDDGNLVVYDAEGQPRWSSGTAGHHHAVLILHDDGNAAIHASDGRRVWECCR